MIGLIYNIGVGDTGGLFGSYVQIYVKLVLGVPFDPNKHKQKTFFNFVHFPSIAAKTAKGLI